MSARYVAATTVGEALDALAADPAARPLAGGTDLVVAARQGKHPLPESIVGVQRIAGLRRVTVRDDALEVGALATHADLVVHPEVLARFAALSDGSALVGSPATRAAGTLGGNVMNASPAMDAGAALLVHDAVVTLAGRVGERSVPAAELWIAPGRTSAGPGELLTRVTFAAPPPRSGSAYVRLEHRRAMEIAIAGAGARISLAADGTVGECRLAITALAPTIRRAPAAEAELTGAEPDDAALERAARLAAAAASPIGDVRAGAGYRRATAAVMAARALRLALERARSAS